MRRKVTLFFGGNDPDSGMIIFKCDFALRLAAFADSYAG